MTRTRFHQGLDELKQKLLTMGGLAEVAVDRAVTAYRDRDLMLCKKVLDGESAINHAEREIDELALDLLAMQQPMAVDLRFILAVMKINADLERIGDQAVNVAQRVMDITALPQADLPVDIPKMASVASEMIRKSLQALIEGDVDLAQSVLEMDDIVDNMNRECFQAMDGIIKTNPNEARQAVDALLISRNIERVADHATNIAEDVIFWVRGADVRHHLGPKRS